MIGGTKALMQDFRSLVGMTSREQDKSVEESISLRTSSLVIGEKLERMEGLGKKELMLQELTVGGIAEQSRVILSSKKFKNELASEHAESKVGRVLGLFRFRSDLIVFQSFLGLSLVSEVMFRKKRRLAAVTSFDTRFDWFLKFCLLSLVECFLNKVSRRERFDFSTRMSEVINDFVGQQMALAVHVCQA